jgi:transcriptional antiterminator RfaH
MTAMISDQFSDREWFIIAAKPGRNVEAHLRLTAQGYASFLPMCLRTRHHARQVEDVARPLFERYQFVGLTRDQPFTPICNTGGVAFVMRGDGRMPLRVRPAVLRRIQERLDADGGMVDMRERRPDAGPMVTWEPGAALAIVDGPFRDFAATLLEWRDRSHSMAGVMVEIFGRQTPVEVPVGMLRPVGEVRAA